MAQELSPDVHPLDEQRDPSEVALVQSLVAQAASRHGADLTRMRRANGYSNATWVGDGIAVRIARTPVGMAREAALVRAPPPEVGHPTILGEGVSQRHGWIVTREVRGRNLGEAWPTLAPAEQRRAVTQLWSRARAVHEATASLSSHVETHGGFIPATHDESTAAGRRAERAIGLSSAQRSRLHALLDEYFRLAPEVPQVVDHGDLALMNALWDGEVVAPLDFEYALLGPVEIDLCRLVCEARVTEDGQFVDSDAGDIAAELAAQEMDPTHGRALIHGAAVLDQLRDLDIWLGNDGGGEPVEEWRPVRSLTGLLAPDGGYLASLVG
ncbi:phosphotransferase [Brachybacterium sp. GPGPB12]|uniref:phosphotransferase family protein n=1 Tax=Brachybacterium sp. GPGPB12 TaxID=3023517 RepID=UPI0031343ECF